MLAETVRTASPQRSVRKEEKCTSSQNLKGLEEDLEMFVDHDRIESKVEDTGNEVDNVEERRKERPTRQRQEPTRLDIE